MTAAQKVFTLLIFDVTSCLDQEEKGDGSQIAVEKNYLCITPS